MTQSKLDRHIPGTWMPRIVVVGAGFGGINLVEKLKGTRAQVVLIDQNNYHTFQPLMYQVATAGLEPGSISSPVRNLFKGQKNFYFRMTKALEVKQDSHRLITKDGDIQYDYLVLALGAQGNFFGNEDLAHGSLTLNNVQDALAIRERFIEHFETAVKSNNQKKLGKLMNIVVVGGGPTGVEIAGAMADLKNYVLPSDYPDFDLDKLDIYLVEALDRLLPGMSEFSGNRAEKYLREMGVEVQLGQKVNSYKNDTIRLENGKEIATRMVIWGAGLKANLIEGFADNQMEKKGKGLTVDDYNRVLNTKNIYAIGDGAYQASEAYPTGLPMLAPVAIQQGRHLAKNIRRMMNKKQPKPFRYKDKGVLATIGRNRAVAEFSSTKIGGKLGWFIWVFIHLMSIMGFRRKLSVFAHWIWSYFTYDQGNRLILHRDRHT